jgi:uncharacterized membrane protein YphA (DoxX/SURF4 family)
MRRELPMILVRVVVGVVFVLEGTLKFLLPNELGVGMFASVGIPFPHLVAPAVGAVEITGGLAIVLNIYAGDAALALLVVIMSALVTTKIPILLGRQFGPFPLLKLPHYGLLSFLHQARTELCMIFGTLAVLIDTGLQLGRSRQWYQDRER